jgi:glutamyl-tRNA synthetase
MYRFAPSPAGDMHIGNLRAALFNYICAQQSNEKFIIRIEDIDKERNIEGKDQEILEILHLFGISFDQVIYQSENLKFHRQLASKLLMDGNAFSCFCTPEIIKRKKEEAREAKVTYHYDGTCKKLSDEEVMVNENPFVVRIKKPDEAIEFTDTIKGKMRFEPRDIDDFVILKVDKTPTYNFACAIDDMLQSIGVIIRGEEHLSNTPKQELIRKYLGYTEKVEYAHLPAILNESGKKMSKEDNSSNVKWLLEEGFLPSAIANYLILIGNKTPTEIFTIDKALEWFELKNISKTPARFDMEKLRELNREHIKRLDTLELSKYIGYSSKDIGELAKVYLEEATTINEIKVKIDTIFSTKTCEDFTEEFEMLKSASKDMPYFKEYDEFKAYLGQKSGLKDKKFLKPLRVLLTGTRSGPNLSDIYPHIKNYLGEIIR